jgi:hypothetical protein
LKPHFEIKYLGLGWYKPTVLTHVTESMCPLPLDFDEQHEHFTTETMIYPSLDNMPQGQYTSRGLLGLRLLDNEDNEESEPYVELANGEQKKMSLIQDPASGKSWWIIKDRWRDDHQQWQGLVPNRMGIMTLVVGQQRCEITTHHHDFSYEELTKYLDTFKQDLWELILDDSSPMRADVNKLQGIGIDANAVNAVDKLLKHAHNILQEPKQELREVQTLKPRTQVKPVTKTFKELATKTNQRLLTSRASQPTFNVPENRYVLYALERSANILKQIIKLATCKAERFARTINKLQEQQDRLFQPIIVNRDLFIKEQEEIRNRTDPQFWQPQINRVFNTPDIKSFDESYCTNQIQLEGSTDDRTGFFFQYWEVEEKMYKKPFDKTSILVLDEHLKPLQAILKTGMELQIEYDREFYETDKCIKLESKNIKAIQFISFPKAEKSLKKAKDEGKKLAANQWQRDPNEKEIEEQTREQVALKNRQQFYTENAEQLQALKQQLEPKLKTLLGYIQQYRTLGIRPASRFPHSMTFVQNVHYQGLHAQYKVLREATKLSDEAQLLQLEQVDAMGLINMPLLYERWVLIQMILVLKNSFRFTPIHADWKASLLQAVTTGQQDIKIGLINKAAKRHLILRYEQTLPNNRRPDYILDLTWDSGNKPDQIQNDPEGNRHTKRFVFDAKFYDKKTFEKAGGYKNKINELYTEKNYSEDKKNPVFLIHPCPDLLKASNQRQTSQEWGAHTDLGEYQSHNQGAVFLNPIDKLTYADELQRLLGMLLQYKLEPCETMYAFDALTLAKPICIRCGSSNLKEIKKSAKNTNRRSRWRECKECQHFTTYNHCYNSKDTCQNSRIIKNGFYWSYHAVKSDDYLNLKCPTCKEWGAW